MKKSLLAYKDEALIDLLSNERIRSPASYVVTADSISGKIEKFWIDGTQNITIHLIHKNIEDGLGDLIKLLEDFE